MKNTWLLVNLAIYSGMLMGALLGWLAPGLVHATLIPSTQQALSGVSLSGAVQSALLAVKIYWPVLGVLIMLTNSLLISLSLFVGVLWQPLLLPLGAIFAFNLFLISAIYTTLELQAFLLLLPVLVLEAQAVILGLTAAFHLAAQPGGYCQRLSAWRVTLPVLRWIPVLLFPAGMWEARLIAALI